MEQWEKPLETFAQVEQRINNEATLRAGAWSSIGSDVQSSYTTQVFDPNVFDGEKYPGGLSPIAELLTLDYWALRQRSNELFHKNLYARGIIRRIVTNVITTGLHLESTPDESIIGAPEDSLLDWAENVENRFFLYNDNEKIIDYKQRRTGGEIQRQIMTESLVGGDCLVVLRQSKKYKLPTVQIVSGDRIFTPPGKMFDDNVVDGVEMDNAGRHVAFYVEDKNAPDGYSRIAAYGRNTGRQQAKLIYGADKREDGVRGEPLLSIAMQPIAEIDRHRDATQRKATLNSIVVAAVKRGASNKRQTAPLSGGGAGRRSKVDVRDADTGETTQITMSDLVPGVNFERLQPDEEVVFYNNNGVDINFGAFEASIIVGVAWALEIPPEVLLLSFNKNYSASQAAINEFKIYLNKEREKFGNEYCDFVYKDWFRSMVLLDRIEAKGYLAELGSVDRWEYADAWTMAEWSGAIKPSTDQLKATNAYKAQCEEGFNTRERSCRELTGQKYSKVIRRLKKENQQLADAMRPILDLENDFGQGAVARMRSNFEVISEREAV